MPIFFVLVPMAIASVILLGASASIFMSKMDGDTPLQEAYACTLFAAPISLPLLTWLIIACNQSSTYDESKALVTTSQRVNGVDIALFDNCKDVINLNHKFGKHIPVGTKIQRKYENQTYCGINFMESPLGDVEIVNEPEDIVVKGSAAEYEDDVQTLTGKK